MSLNEKYRFSPAFNALLPWLSLLRRAPGAGESGPHAARVKIDGFILYVAKVKP